MQASILGDEFPLKVSKGILKSVCLCPSLRPSNKVRRNCGFGAFRVCDVEHRVKILECLAWGSVSVTVVG